jgi:geranylgeranyl diphosphate synthase, type I
MSDDSRVIDWEAMLDSAMRCAIDQIEPSSAQLANMARYHMGWVSADFEPVAPGSVNPGKRIRPRIAMLVCMAQSGDGRDAVPIAAAIELLHNFTLVHDDVQDRSELRRHRQSVWSLWGEAQAINVGDSLFAASHLALFQMDRIAAESSPLTRLAPEFDQMAIRIVGGQSMDLAHEGNVLVTPEQYLTMIRGKTAAILRYSAWAGAIVADAIERVASKFGDFGEALGMAFQIRDDLLGIWGDSNETGKAATGDIWRRKQTLPILELRRLVSPIEREEVDRLYSAEVDAQAVRRILDLLHQYNVKSLVENEIAAYHNLAEDALLEALPAGNSPSRSELLDLVGSLQSRVA